MSEPQDTAGLVRRARRGEAAAFEALARKFLRAAYVIALAVVGRPADAEDVAQEGVALALGRIDSCREPERFAPWLFQIVRRRALNLLDSRRLRDVPRDLPSEDAAVASAEGAIGDAGLRGRLSGAIDKLSMVQREVVLLHDLEEWTHAEIAAALGISEVNSRQHLFVARRTLRGLLADPADVTPVTKVKHG